MKKRQQKEPARYYVVENKQGDGKCLVEANSPTQALSYAAQHFATARVATVREAVNMEREGFPVIRWNRKPEQADIEEVAGYTGPAAPIPAGQTVTQVDTPQGPVPLVETAAQNLDKLDEVLAEANAPDPYLAGIAARPTPAGDTTTGSAAPASTGSTSGTPERRRLMAGDVFGAGFGKKSDDL